MKVFELRRTMKLVEQPLTHRPPRRVCAVIGADATVTSRLDVLGGHLNVLGAIARLKLRGALGGQPLGDERVNSQGAVCFSDAPLEQVCSFAATSRSA